MTDKEKAKAYDEALALAKRLISNNCTEVEKLCLKCVFPELKESEDEKIRKEIIEYFEHYSGGDNVSIKFPKWIAYLKKQKDASKAIEAVEKIDKYIDEHLANAHDMKDSNPDKKYYRGLDDALGKMSGILQDVYSGEKQKEQKPIVTHGETYHVDTLGTQQVIAGKMPQKSTEWSKEDERILKGIIGLIDHDQHYGVSNNEMISWLKSLRPQQKVEWCDEDADMLNCCISSIEEAKENRYAYKETDGDTSYDREIDWLKSLRPSWKPSEKQMRYLLAVINDPNNIGAESCYLTIKSLYNDLKKLT